MLILIVLLIHIFYLTTREYFEAGHMAGPSPWFIQPTRWFFPGFFLVGSFVVLSGYCLMLPVTRSANKKLAGGTLSYLWRRARRILPPYYAAVVLSLIRIVFFPTMFDPQAHPLQKWNLLSHLLLFYNFDPRWRFQINGPYWSLAPEWQLYLLFPLLLVPLWGKIGTKGLVAFAAFGTIGLTLISPNVRDMHPWFLLLFALGMLGAVITESRDEWVIAMRERTPWPAIAWTLFLTIVAEWIVFWLVKPDVFIHHAPPWWAYCINEILLGAATCASIINWTKMRRSGRAMHQWPLLLRFLHRPRVMLLGRFSYSHYLIHYPILLTTTALVISWHLRLLESVAVAYLISTPASLGFSYLFFLAVENRFLSKRVTLKAATQQRLSPEDTITSSPSPNALGQ